MRERDSENTCSPSGLVEAVADTTTLPRYEHPRPPCDGSEKTSPLASFSVCRALEVAQVELNTRNLWVVEGFDAKRILENQARCLDLNKGVTQVISTGGRMSDVIQGPAHALHSPLQ